MIYQGTPYAKYMNQVQRILEESTLVKNKNDLMMGNMDRSLQNMGKHITEFKQASKEWENARV